MAKIMKDENDSYLKPGQKDENDSYVGKKKSPRFDELAAPGRVKAAAEKRKARIEKVLRDESAAGRRAMAAGKLQALRDRISPDRSMGMAGSISSSVRKAANRKDATNPKKVKSLDGLYMNAKKGEAAGKKYLGSLKK